MSESEKAAWWDKELERREFFRSRGLPFEEFTLEDQVEICEDADVEAS
jgi:hypothetical protein